MIASSNLHDYLAQPVIVDALNYMVRRETPVRRLQHEAVARLAPKLSGKVIELGGFGEGRRRYATAATEYIVSNVAGEGVTLDAANMDLPDNSVDAFVCESMLEHVEDPPLVISEIRRVLKPGGRLLLLTPWMYPFHSAPDDFLRFSESALRRLLDGFDVLESLPLGNFWTAMATFAQLKVSPWRAMSKPERLGRLVIGAPLLGAGLFCWGLGQVFREHDDFSAAYCVLAEKRRVGDGAA